jgi:hypothetical protein
MYEVSTVPLFLFLRAGAGRVTGVKERFGVHVGAGGQLTDRNGGDVNTSTVGQAVLIGGISKRGKKC